MERKPYFTQEEKLLDEIIDNVGELPIESQNQILMMAKEMKHTKKGMRERSSESA